ncbi:MAG: FHA domain-containing protein, partial [Firmicutes bacterium]|nr:FHA domain-containing protein [Bacillota bacterium]
ACELPSAEAPEASVCTDSAATMPLSSYCAQPYGRSRSYYLVEMNTNRSFVISKALFVIGALPECDLCVAQPPETAAVSRLHALLLLKNGKAYLKDQSTNGTFLGELGMPDSDFYRLPKDTEVEIRSGQVVRFALFRYLFMAEEGDS